jgi:protein SDA1
MLSDSSTIAAKKSLEVMIELYQKNIWNDTKTVNVIAEACLSDVPKLVAPSLHFFLGTNDAKVDEDEDIEVPDLTGLRHANTVNKKRKSRANTMEKAQAKVRRTERQRNKVEHFNFSALHLINDPQGFSEKLFQKLKKVSNKNVFNFELRLEMMNLISRLIGVHKLTLLGFYDFVISYIKPHQKKVTQILAFIAQASHELVPPDALENCIRAIADNFIWSNCAAEVITAGMNALREICTRCPLAMPEELLQSLLDDYKNHKDKGPMTAARALLGLFREFNPSMLKKKDRGKAASMSMKNLSQKSFGQVDLHNDVLGAELLQDESDSEEAPELVDGEFEEGDSWEEVDDEEELSEFEGDLDDLEEIEEELEEEEEEQGSPLKKVKLTKESWGTQKVLYN